MGTPDRNSELELGDWRSGGLEDWDWDWVS